MATSALNTTRRKGSLDLLTTDDEQLPQYLINGIPIAPPVIVEVSSTYTATTSDDVIVGSGTFTIDLPPVATAIKNVSIKSVAGGGTLTVDGDGSETIDGSATQIITAGTAITISPTSSGWVII